MASAIADRRAAPPCPAGLVLVNEKICWPMGSTAGRERVNPPVTIEGNCRVQCFFYIIYYIKIIKLFFLYKNPDLFLFILYKIRPRSGRYFFYILFYITFFI